MDTSNEQSHKSGALVAGLAGGLIAGFLVLIVFMLANLEKGFSVSTISSEAAGKGKGKSATPTPPVVVDDTPPIIEWITPVDGGIVKAGSVVKMEASAYDPETGVRWVTLSVNANTDDPGVLCIDEKDPYTCTWQVPAKSGEVYTLVASVVGAADYDDLDWYSNHYTYRVITVTAK